MKLTMGMLKEKKGIKGDFYGREMEDLIGADFDNIELHENVIKVEKNNSVYLYDYYGNVLLDNKKSIILLNEGLIRAESFDGKFELYNANGKRVFDFECSLIEIIADITGHQYLKVQRSDLEHGLYRMDLNPIIPCGNNHISYTGLAVGAPIRVKWNHRDLISYLLDGGKLRVV